MKLYTDIAHTNSVRTALSDRVLSRVSKSLTSTAGIVQESETLAGNIINCLLEEVFVCWIISAIEFWRMLSFWNNLVSKALKASGIKIHIVKKTGQNKVTLTDIQMGKKNYIPADIVIVSPVLETCGCPLNSCLDTKLVSTVDCLVEFFGVEDLLPLPLQIRKSNKFITN